MATCFALGYLVQQRRDGDRGTPLLPGQKWHVHDPDRPYPHEVTPGIDGSPPSDAVVLYDGKDLSQWVGADGQPSKWKVEHGYVEVRR